VFVKFISLNRTQNMLRKQITQKIPENQMMKRRKNKNYIRQLVV